MKRLWRKMTGRSPSKTSQEEDSSRRDASFADNNSYFNPLVSAGMRILTEGTAAILTGGTANLIGGAAKLIGGAANLIKDSAETFEKAQEITSEADKKLADIDAGVVDMDLEESFENRIPGNGNDNVYSIIQLGPNREYEKADDLSINNTNQYHQPDPSETEASPKDATQTDYGVLLSTAEKYGNLKETADNNYIDLPLKKAPQNGKADAELKGGDTTPNYGGLERAVDDVLRGIYDSVPKTYDSVPPPDVQTLNSADAPRPVPATVPQQDYGVMPRNPDSQTFDTDMSLPLRTLDKPMTRNSSSQRALPTDTQNISPRPPGFAQNDQQARLQVNAASANAQNDLAAQKSAELSASSKTTEMNTSLSMNG